MKEKLNELLNSGVLAELHLLSNSEGKFYCGRIVGVDDEHFAYLSYGPYGDYDGYHIITIADISEIAVDTKYLNGLEIVIGENKIEPVIFKTDKIVSEMLNLSLEQKKIVSFFADNADDWENGFITEINEDVIKLDMVDEFGESDGKKTVIIEDIMALDFDTRQVRKVEKLYFSKH